MADETTFDSDIKKLEAVIADASARGTAANDAQKAEIAALQAQIAGMTVGSTVTQAHLDAFDARINALTAAVTQAEAGLPQLPTPTA